MDVLPTSILSRPVQECREELSRLGDLTEEAVNYTCLLRDLFAKGSRGDTELLEEKQFLQACNCLQTTISPSALEHASSKDPMVTLAPTEVGTVDAVTFRHVLAKHLNSDCNDYKTVATMIEKARFYRSRYLLITDLHLTQVPSVIEGLADTLHELTIRELDIHAFPEGIRSLVNLRKLHVSQCPIYVVPPWISELKLLEDLTVSRCRLFEMDHTVMHALAPTLKYLDLSYNHLVYLPCVKSMAICEVLNVDSNANLDLFSGYDTVSSRDEQWLPRCRTLMMSMTRTIRIPLGPLRESLVAIEWRKAKGEITLGPTNHGASTGFPNLQHLALAGSTVSEPLPLEHMPSLKHLNIARCLILNSGMPSSETTSKEAGANVGGYRLTLPPELLGKVQVYSIHPKNWL